jgi:hypothetical protein
MLASFMTTYYTRKRGGWNVYKTEGELATKNPTRGELDVLGGKGGLRDPKKTYKNKS